MDILGSVFEIASTIYGLCDQASSNKKLCLRLKKRITMLLVAAEKLKRQSGKSKEMNVALRELLVTLRNAKSWVIKYSNRVWWRKIIQANGIKEEFDLINDRLRDHADDLSLLLSVEHRNDFLKIFSENKRHIQNQKDIKEDIQDLKAYLNSSIIYIIIDINFFLFTRAVENMSLDAHHAAVEEIKSLLSVNIRTPWNIAEIKVEDLELGDSMMMNNNFELRKGQYHKSPVAIKILKGQLMNDDVSVRKTFHSEVETMKKFECVNIIRIFGICIGNSNTEPFYAMVTELCENGNLRDLLTRKQDLTWEQRILMTLDATRALYRLHHTESKAILHGSLSSLKFLVDGTYCLKLCGFELSKTESSMRRTCNSEKRKEMSDWLYIAPETLDNINAYDKRSEIYRSV
ncbi:hypothetical protein GDO86_008088, partial [Hymenochirus boettgeri]